jgi:CheY-like chemotaxis protein
LLPVPAARQQDRYDRELIVNKSVSEVKVLVVDDQPLIVEELCDWLESEGYRCVPAHSTDQAIEQYIADEAIGLVLCDLHMPERDGIELVRALKQIAGNQRLFEAIMLTGRADKQDVIRALREGFADYYQKPMDLAELLEGVRRQELPCWSASATSANWATSTSACRAWPSPSTNSTRTWKKPAARACIAAPRTSRRPSRNCRRRSRSCRRARWKWQSW